MEEIIKARLAYDIDFCKMCLLKLYELQTQDEQNDLITNHTNEKGFNKPDSTQLSIYAQFTKDGGHLSDKEIRDLTKRMIKYTTQLASILTEDEIEY